MRNLTQQMRNLTQQMKNLTYQIKQHLLFVRVTMVHGMTNGEINRTINESIYIQVREEVTPIRWGMNGAL